jgi:hypothetical protein
MPRVLGGWAFFRERAPPVTLNLGPENFQEFELNEDQKEGMQLGYFRVKVSNPKP